MPSLWGGLIAKGGLYAVVWFILVSTNPPIRRVNSSCISGLSPTFQLLQPTIYLIKGGGGLYAGGAYSEGGAYMPDYTVHQIDSGDNVRRDDLTCPKCISPHYNFGSESTYRQARRCKADSHWHLMCFL